MGSDILSSFWKKSGETASHWDRKEVTLGWTQSHVSSAGGFSYGIWGDHGAFLGYVLTPWVLYAMDHLTMIKREERRHFATGGDGCLPSPSKEYV